ncbi:glycine N-acyltransferase-like protein 3 [Zootoca vivipara]|uniref:glycine N-acyltransferase-like protein 3 n=1 Tax=Zootoca vivipara TaxID=8524 RepID=UPI001592957E|nr:glycine N-acyltransferase-like protein 3 [Zootoca vivipara]
MLILSCSSKLHFLEGLLKKSLPQTLQVYGAVMNINRGNPVGHEVIVDSWPDFKAVLTRPQREAVSDSADSFNNIYAAFYRDLDAYRRLLLDTDAISWDQAFSLCGNHDGIYEVSKDAVAVKKVQLTAIPYFIYLDPKPDKEPQPRLDPGFTFSSLNSSHIDLLNETWHYGGSEHSRKYLDNMVRCFPSTCILDSNGHPISWIIMESWGSSGHSYTLRSHRRRGYSYMVQRAHGMRVHAAGFPFYGLVALDNNPQQKLLESLGFQRLSEPCHYCIHSPASQ